MLENYILKCHLNMTCLHLPPKCKHVRKVRHTGDVSMEEEVKEETWPRGSLR